MSRWEIPLDVTVALRLLICGLRQGLDCNRPAVNPPAVFPATTISPGTNSFADLSWWQIYQDTALQTLTREALTNNYDLQIAVARMEQSRAVAMRKRVPSLRWRVDLQWRLSAAGKNDLFGSAFPNNAATVNSASATLNAFWEVDLWGRVRRLN